MSRDPPLVLADIEQGCAKVVCYSAGLSRDEAFRDEMRLDAILMNLHMIGEAAKSLPEGIRQRHADVPRREISGLRDIIAHVYFALDLSILWSPITDDVPPLLARIREIIEDESAGRDQVGP